MPVLRRCASLFSLAALVVVALSSSCGSDASSPAEIGEGDAASDGAPSVARTD